MPDHRRFWDAMHAVTVEQLQEISRRIALRVVAMFGLDCSSVALDMTNFATFIDTGNGKAPIAQRGKAKQKRSDLRPVGLGLVVTRGGGIPLAWHAHPGDRPDVTQFPAMVDQLRGHYEAICAAAATAPAADMTVVFDAGQNSESNFAHLPSTNLHYIGSVPASDCPDLTALPASARTVVDEQRLGGLTAMTPGAWSTAPSAARFSPIPGTAPKPGPRGSTAPPWPRPAASSTSWPPPSPAARRPREKAETEITAITRKPWVSRVITWQPSGGKPRDLRLA